MGGRVPFENMTRERQALLNEVEELDPARCSKSRLLALIERLANAATICPRMECATCEHMARSETEQQRRVGEAEAG